MPRFLAALVISLLAPAVVSADFVLAEWTSFNNGPVYSRTGGSQSGATLTGTFGNAAVTGGAQLNVGANNHQWPGVALAIQFDAGFPDLALTYDVTRIDGNGANRAPTSVSWSYTAGGQTFSLGSTSIPRGSSSFSLDLSSLPDSVVTLRASFSGAAGGKQNHLNFDNFRITSSIPEPATWSLLAGAASILLLRRRRRSA